MLVTTPNKDSTRQNLKLEDADEDYLQVNNINRSPTMRMDATYRQIIFVENKLYYAFVLRWEKTSFMFLAINSEKLMTPEEENMTIDEVFEFVPEIKKQLSNDKAENNLMIIRYHLEGENIYFHRKSSSASKVHLETVNDVVKAGLINETRSFLKDWKRQTLTSMQENFPGLMKINPWCSYDAMSKKLAESTPNSIFDESEMIRMAKDVMLLASKTPRVFQ